MDGNKSALSGDGTNLPEGRVGEIMLRSDSMFGVTIAPIDPKHCRTAGIGREIWAFFTENSTSLT
jgi:hypothetical protein